MLKMLKEEKGKVVDQEVVAGENILHIRFMYYYSLFPIIAIYLIF